MTAKFPDDELIRLADYVARTLGLHFPAERWRDLERAIVGAAVESGFADPASFTHWLLFKSPTKTQLEVLASHLTVGETYFFREMAHFDFLEKQILPAMIQARQNGNRQLRIWCAACCSGEEPYSIAILLRRMIPALEQWNLTLLATDINPRFLEKAEAGIYGEWSFRDAPPWLKGQYFRETKTGRFEVLPEVKRMVRFAQLNLAEDSYPSLSNDTNAMDVIFCRNVLMYFTGEQAHKVIEKLYRSQMEKGWMFVGPSELLHLTASPYSMVKTERTILYQKDSSFTRNATVPAAATVQAVAPSLLEPAPYYQIKPTKPTTPAAAALEYNVEPPSGSAISEQLYLSAGQLYEQGRYADAMEKLHAMPSALPHGPVLRLMTRCLANQGRLMEALACCDNWIASDKLDASSHYLRAAILQEQNAIEEAARSLRRAIYLDSEFVLAYFELGNIARRRGRCEEAARHFENTRRLLCCRPCGDVLSESEGMTAGRLMEILSSFPATAEAL